MADGTEDRPALQVLELSIGERVRTLNKLWLADVYGKTAVFVIDNHHCYLDDEIRAKCQRVRNDRLNQGENRKRRNRIDKSCQ